MDIRKLDLNLLVTLEALLAERNVTKAAERLGLSQPAVSAQLSRLRDLFGDQLLVPAQRGMTPTAHALELEHALGPALDGVRKVVTHGLTFDPESEKLTVSIMAPDAVQYSVLMPFALQLRSRAPGIRLAFRGYDLPSLEKQAESGAIDLAVTRPELAPQTFRSRRLQEGSFVLIARRNHPVVRRSVTLDQFLALEHIIVEPGSATFGGPLDRSLETLGHHRNVVLSVANFLVVAELVARSDMIAIVPRDIVVDRADRLQLLEPPIEMEGFSTVLVWHERNHAHAGHRWVREALAATVSRR
jgi:DNA-binding transcriptional LysR family regulator